MRRIALTLIAASSLWLAGGCVIGNAAMNESGDFEETLSFEAGNRFELENTNGRVIVDTWDRDEVRIEARKKSSSRRRLEDIEIDIDETSNGISVTTRLPKSRLFGGSGSVDYRITLPPRAGIRIKTVNGKVEVRHVEGELEAASVNGSVIFEEVAGEVSARTVNGRIEARYSRADPDGRHRFRTTNGSIRLELPEDVSGEFEAGTVNGSIRTDFPLEVHGRWGPKKLSGTLGSGHGSFEVKTVNGSVRIAKT